MTTSVGSGTDRCFAPTPKRRRPAGVVNQVTDLKIAHLAHRDAGQHHRQGNGAVAVHFGALNSVAMSALPTQNGAGQRFDLSRG
ncbi:MAG: hypothetical protein HC853_00685 [Anaerolineae bacterium]|nr:hypothetical protein [Anaerolineae bacterium]